MPQKVYLKFSARFLHTAESIPQVERKVSAYRRKYTSSRAQGFCIPQKVYLKSSARFLHTAESIPQVERKVSAACRKPASNRPEDFRGMSFAICKSHEYT
jgi:hypothetical protein